MNTKSFSEFDSPLVGLVAGMLYLQKLSVHATGQRRCSEIYKYNHFCKRKLSMIDKQFKYYVSVQLHFIVIIVIIFTCLYVNK